MRLIKFKFCTSYFLGIEFEMEFFVVAPETTTTTGVIDQSKSKLFWCKVRKMVVKPIHLRLFCLPSKDAGGALFTTSSDDEVRFGIGLVSGIKKLGDRFFGELGRWVGI